MSKRKRPALDKPAAEPTAPTPTAVELAGHAEHAAYDQGTLDPTASDHATPDEVDYDDHDLLGQADWVIGGEAARKARQQGLYAGYVLFLGALVYGLPIVQAVFRTSDASSLGDQLSSPEAIALLVASVAALLGAVVFAGRFRGPVVPPMPWIDLVLPVPPARAPARRRWGRSAAVGGIFVGALSAPPVGGAPPSPPPAGVMPVTAPPLVGPALGVPAPRLWL